MNGNAWKDLLTELGCLDNGRFVCPPEMREVTICVSAYGGGVDLMITHDSRKPGEWSYTDDFIVHRDAKGHASYYAWSGVVAVFTNPM